MGFVLSLSPCGRGWLREAKTGEGFLSADTNPSSVADFVRAIFSHKGRRMRSRYFFAKRSTKVLPPFILWVSGASLIWITTASASTPRFFTSAWVMSRIMPAFCSSVRPVAMFTVISGIFCHSLCSCYFPNPVLVSRRHAILHGCHHSRKRMIQYSAPVHVHIGVTAYWMPAFAGMTILAWLSPLHLPPLHLMARQHLVHLGDDLAFFA